MDSAKMTWLLELKPMLAKLKNTDDAFQRIITNPRYFYWIVFVIILALALVIRLSFIDFVSKDMSRYIYFWHEHISNNGLFWALRETDFTDYTPPYLYYITLLAYLKNYIPVVVGIKALSIVFDFVLAYYVYKIVELKYKRDTFIPMMGAMATLFSPETIVNSSIWGQCDGIYTSLLLMCFYNLLKHRNLRAAVLWGMAFSIKLQSVFFLPVLVVFYLKGSLRLRHLLAIPVSYMCMMLPALIAGRPLKAVVWHYYLYQIGEFKKQMTLNTANAYSWFVGYNNEIAQFGILFLVCTLIFLIVTLHKFIKIRITPDIAVRIAAVFLFLFPFLLPQMHERYWFVFNVMAIILTCYSIKYWYVVVAMQTVTFASYSVFLFGQNQIQMRYTSEVVCVVFLMMIHHFIKDLRSINRVQRQMIKPNA